MKGLYLGNRFIRWEIPAIIISLIVTTTMCCVKCSSGRDGTRSDVVAEPEVELLYGFDTSKYDIVQGKVES